MPSTSKAQAKLMRATAHGWKMPGGGGPSQAVGKDFMAADQALGKKTEGKLPARKTKPVKFA
jgi:hypothetical protein